MFFLVTGGLGYLGGRLLEHLSVEGHGVRATTRRSLAACPEWAKEWDILQVDIYDKSAWVAALEDVDFVFHLAAPDAGAAASDPSSALRAGGEMTWGLLEAVAEAKRRIPVINLSTIHVYGPKAKGLITESLPPAPIHPYAIGQLLSEFVTQSFRSQRGITTLNVRLSNAFGRPMAPDAAKWSLVFNDLCRQAAVSDRLRLNSSGKQKRNFITLGDTVRALSFLAERHTYWPDDHTIHLGSTVHWSIRDVAERVAGRCQALWGKRPEIIIPEAGESSTPEDFIFDVTRLVKAGFAWQSHFDQEIDETLLACRKWRNEI